MIRKRWPSLVILFCGLLLCLQPFRISLAAIGDAGSSDPLITLSYLQASLISFKEEIQVMVSEQIKTALAALPGDSATDPAAEAKWEILGLLQGDRLTGAGGTEMILRAGEALAIGNTENEGVADLTEGVDLKTGDTVQRNHHLLIPRPDGRGLDILVYSTVMVKGAYTVTTN